MKTNLKFTDTEHDEVLREYAETKVEAFGKLMKPEDFEAAVCDVEFKHDTHHQSGDVCYAEVTLEADGKIFRSSKVEPTMEKAIDKVKDDILQALRVEKEKHESQYLKGAREGKEMLRGGE
jgi:ribosome-associated translation inhibitor RaiA